MSLSVLEITYVVQCLCLKDDDNINPIRGEANYGQSDTRKEKDETLDQMAQAVKALQQQVLHLANQLATTSALMLRWNRPPFLLCVRKEPPYM